MSIKLTDTVLVILSAAAQREDRCIAAPPLLKGAAAQKIATKLLAAGLAREVRAKPGVHVWRRDEATGQTYALKVTAAGLDAIAVDEELAAEREAGDEAGSQTQAVAAAALPPSVPAARSKKGKTSRAGPTLAMNFAPTTSATPGPVDPLATIGATPREGSKLAALIAMLGGGDGATIEQLATAMHWLPHTTRAALTGLRKRGYEIRRDRTGNERASRYRVAQTQAPAHRA